MFNTPYSTIAGTQNEHALRAENERKSFATWQAMTASRNRILTLMRWGRADTAKSLDGRWMPAE